MHAQTRKLIHWIALTSILMSALAPTLSQAASIVKHGQGFAMEICTVDGSKMELRIQADSQADSQLDQADQTQPCPYCVAHTSITPTFNTHLKFQAPQSLALLPQLFYQSPRPLAIWLSPPSAAPPTQA